MAYELTLKLKQATLEVEGDTVKELEARLAALDLPRLERLLRDALRGKRITPAAPKGRAKAAGKRKPTKKASK